jgi:hypothetical protein
MSPTSRRLGLVIFILAICLGVLLTVASVWPDLEAFFYGFERLADQPLVTLTCPVLMTTHDRAAVAVRLHNPEKRVIKQRLLVQLSGLFITTQEQEVELQPGEWRTVSWEVGPENIDLERFIFARVFAYPAASLRMSEANCGVLVLDLPFAGGPQFFFGLLALAVLGAGLGLWLWTRGRAGDFSVHASGGRMRFIAIVVAVGLLAGALGVWGLGLLALVVAALTLVVFLVRNTG